MANKKRKSNPSANTADRTLEKGLLAVRALMKNGEYKKALAKFEKYEQKYPEHPLIILNRSGLRIDAGERLDDMDMIEQAVLDIEMLLENTVPDSFYGILHYNRANGIQHRIRKYFDDHGTYFGAEEDIAKCMDSFKQVGTDDAIVNLGNLYDEIGRPLEAIVTYEKVTVRTPDFGMAIGNKALAVENLVPISEYQAAYLVYAHQLYEQALGHKESVIEHGGVHSLHDFTSRRDNIAAHLKHTGHEDWLERDLAHDAFNAEDYSEDEASYVQFCLENDLYLNLHFFDRQSAASIGDVVSTGFISRVRDDAEDARVKEMFMRTNEIKESYVTGRYLLWQSQQRTQTLASISEQTLFVNNLDYTMHNIYTGLLKSAYKEAFSALDKIANILNYYLELGNEKENRINYRNVWYTDLTPKKGYHPKILEQNFRLFGLYSVLQDLGGDPSEVRNSLEHRYFKVGTMSSGDGKPPTFEELTKQTIDAYYEIKSAITYLLNFIHSCEEAKRAKAQQESKWFPTMPVVTDQWLDLV